MNALTYECPRCTSTVGALLDGRLERHPAADGLPCIDTAPADVRRARGRAVRMTLSDAELDDLRAPRTGRTGVVTSESLRRRAAWMA